jgi:hypothetical protein
VGISIVFKIFSNLPFLGVGLTPGSTSNVLDKNIYGLGVGISIVFEIFSNLSCLGVGLTPVATSNMLHLLSVTQGTRIYMI